MLHFPALGSIETLLKRPLKCLKAGFGITRWLKFFLGITKKPKKKLPSSILNNIRKASKADNGLHYNRQLHFGLVDLEYHSKAPKDVLKTWEKVQKKVFPVELPKGAIPPAGFGHLMGGYESGYYGYLWSEVYAEDLFAKFEKSGLLNTKLGKKYRETILEKGGSEDPDILLKKFLGRAPNEKAFFKKLALK